MNALKFIAAVFVGMMLGGLAIWAVEMVGHNLYPPPADIDVSNPQNVAKAIADAPMSALLFVVLAYAVGAFIGGLVAQLIKNGPSVLSALTTGLILLIFWQHYTPICSASHLDDCCRPCRVSTFFVVGRKACSQKTHFHKIRAI
jgi:hypothetical protein